MKKRIVCVLLSLIMTTVSLYGCGANTGGADAGMADTPRADAPSNNIVQSDRVSSDAGAEGGMQIAGEAAFYEMDVCAAPADIALPDWNTE